MADEEEAKIHPRIHGRWKQTKRDAGRRRLRVLIVAGSILGTVLVVWGILLTPLVNVDYVRISGAKILTNDEIVRASKIDRGAPMIRVNVGRARRGIASVPRVKSVSVTRDWPATIRISVRERVAVATVAVGAKAVLIDSEGVAFAPASPLPDSLPVLRGVAVPALGASLKGSNLDIVAVADAMPKDLVARIHDINKVSDGTLEMHLSGVGKQDATILFGPPTQGSTKVEALTTLLDNVSLTGVATIDVRVPGAPVLTRR